MEKKYALVEIQEELENIAETLISGQEKYPFKKYLFETALNKDRTEIKNRDEFDRNIEIYKKLKEMTYLNSEKIDIVVNDSGKVETFTKDEAALIVAAMENKVVDVETDRKAHV